MKIAHLVSHSFINGVATSVRSLIEAQLAAGHDVMLISRAGSWVAEQAYCRPVTLIESPLTSTPGEFHRVRRILLDWKSEVAHCHGSSANKYGMALRLSSRMPVVMTAHTRQLQIPWRFAHAVIGLSRDTADYYANRLMVARENIHLVPNLFDATDLRPVTAPDRSAARRLLRLRPEAFVVGTVGEVSHRKNQVEALRVLRRLVEMGVDAELLLIGPGVDEAHQLPGWLTVVGDKSVTGRLHMTGHRFDATDLLAAMDVFLMTSRNEQAPVAPLEAMARALPVLSTRVGNMARLLPATQLFELNDTEAVATALSKLLDPAERERLGAAGRDKVASSLSPAKILPEILDVYRAAARRAGAL